METVDTGAHGQVVLIPALSLVQGVVAGAAVVADSGAAWVEVLTAITQVQLPAVTLERPG